METAKMVSTGQLCHNQLVKEQNNHTYNHFTISMIKEDNTLKVFGQAVS